MVEVASAHRKFSDWPPDISMTSVSLANMIGKMPTTTSALGTQIHASKRMKYSGIIVSYYLLPTTIGSRTSAFHPNFRTGVTSEVSACELAITGNGEYLRYESMGFLLWITMNCHGIIC